MFLLKTANLENANSMFLKHNHHLKSLAGFYFFVYLCGCNYHHNDVYYKDRALCLNEEKLLFADVQFAVLEAGADDNNILYEVAHKSQNHMYCPVMAEKYLLNPDIQLWIDSTSVLEVAVVCPKHHRSMPEGKSVFLAVTFHGTLTELPELPNWAIKQVELNENGSLINRRSNQ